jgi:hypothetical protein
VLRFWKTKPTEVDAPAEPEMTPAQYLLEADIALKIARENYANACLQVSQFKVRHPDYVQVGNAIVRQFFPENPEWKAATRRESQAHDAMCKAIERRAALIEQYGPRETRHIAGVLQR